MSDASHDARIPVPPAIVLQYVPFFVLGLFLMQVDVRNPRSLAWSLLVFLGISLVIVWRQVLLYREVQQSNVLLEERVRRRTLRVEELQRVMLRNERLNAVAIVGAGLSHDLNNLLGVIRANAELLHDGIRTGQQLCPDEVEPILEATSQAAQLTQQLMSFARSGSASAVPVQVDLCQAVAKSEELLHLLLPRTIRLRLSLEAPYSVVRIPATMLEQVLVNLVSNARDAMPRGGEVTARVRRAFVGDVAAAVLDISDTGPGIAPDLHEAIFDPYYTTKRNHGNGIGLASVRALMESVGGTVTLDSRVGQGTTFSLAFPLCIGDHMRGSVRTPAIPPTALAC